LTPGDKFVLWLDEGDDEIIFSNLDLDDYLSSPDKREPRADNGGAPIYVAYDSP
jgi:hypothetical protein